MVGTDGRTLLFVLPSLAGGGAERVVVTLANSLAEARWRVHLVTVHGSGPLYDEVSDDVIYHDLGRRRVLSALVALPGLVRRLGPDVVICTPAHVNLAVLLTRFLFPAKTRVFAREANMPSRTLPTQPLPALFGALSRWLYPRADLVLCPARRVAQELETLFRVPPARIHVLPNPVDWDALVHARAAPLRESGDGLRFVAAGRLTPQKNFAALIECMQTAPAGSVLTVFGVGPLEAELRALAASSEFPDRVRFRGFSSELGRWFAGADAVVLPSLWEGMPNVALEALGCGARVIAMRSAGGIAELEPLRDGCLILVDDVPALRQALANLQPAPDHDTRECLLAPEHERGQVASRLAVLCGGMTEVSA